MKFVKIKIRTYFNYFFLLSIMIFVVTPTSAAQHRATQLTPGMATSFTDFGRVVSTAGDVNNDGFSDIIVGRPNSRTLYVYYGSASGQFTPASGSVGTPDWQDTVTAGNFGSALAAGDFNCDGIDDVAVGAYSGGTVNEGQVYVYYGSNVTGLSGTPDWRAESDTNFAWFGWSVSSAGDINQDGCNDLLVGGRRSGRGIAALFFGNSAGLADADSDGVAHPSDYSWSVTSTSGDLGQAVAGIGDVNNDTVDDILVGSRNGNVYIYYGVANGTPNTSADWSDMGGGTFGRTVARADKVNGDTIADFIIGQPAGNGGRVHLYYGATGGPRTDGNPDWSYIVPSEGHSHGSDSGFASTISRAGDVNGDGYDDFMVGWPVYHGGLTGHLGRLYLFHGSASGPAINPDEVVDGLQEGAQFATSVSTAGDVDGDLRDDFVIGAPSHSIALGGATSGTGTAFAYLSGSSPAHITIDPPQSYSNFHVTSEDGMSKTSSFTVVLDTLPSAEVTVNITSNNSAEGVVSPAVLTFTTGDWNVPQTVSIAGVDDPLDDGDVQYSISITIVSSGSEYSSVTVDDINVTNQDDDAVGIIIEPIANLITTEDLGTDTFTIVLDAQPTDSVTIGLSSSDPGEGSVFPAAVTFTPVDFRTPQQVTITGVDDAILDGNILYTIITAPAVSADNRYNNLNAVDLAVANHDNNLQTSLNILEGDQLGSLFGRTVSRAGDINGDGFADFIVGAPKHDNGQTNEGRVYVYFGAPTGFSATPWSAEYNQVSAEFGWSVASAGDVNGDGFDDIIIGARKYDGGETDEGRVFVYYGSATGLPATPDWMAEIDQANANFGAAVSGAGDVNGDGFDDILVGADNYYAADFVSSGASQFIKEGAAFLFYGSATGLSDTVPDGVAHLSDGDVAWQGETGGSNAISSAKYGRTLSRAGDVNCDGFADIIVGAPQYNLTSFTAGLWGRVWVYYGGPSGLRSDGNADWTMLGVQSSTSFGSSVGGAGNINGDMNGSYSCDDIIIGADSYESTIFPVSENNEGQIYVYYGSPTGLADTPSWTHENNQANSKLGISSAVAGDINNDGFADIIAGANRYDSGETDEGRVYIYFGSATGPGNPLTREINQASAYFGTAVDGVGDVDGDGKDDFIVGATLYDGDLFNEGAAFLYLSDEAAIKVHPMTGLETTETGDSAAFSVVLTDTPSANVTLALSSDLTEGTLSSPSLLFTPANWFVPQNVTVTGVDDSDVDGNVPYSVVLAAAVSADNRYNGLDANDVPVVNLDNEQPTVSITATDSAASETGSNTGTFTVSRTGGSPSPLQVFYTLNGTATNGLDYQNLAGSVTIAAGNSSAAITLIPLLDGFFEPNETVILTLSADIAYIVGTANASVNISDGTANGITISPTNGLITTEQGGNDIFSVVLDSLPTADVTINFSSDTPGEGHPLVDSVVFTTVDWDIPQTVTVVGQDDALADGDVLYNIVTSVTSSDSSYNVLNPDDVAVTNRDDDNLPVVNIVTRTYGVNEGGVATFRISRTGNTATNLVVNYSVVGGTATNGVDYITPSGSVTIFGGQSYRDFNVNTISDIDPESDETVILSLSDDTAYIVSSPRADTAIIRGDPVSFPVSFGPDQMVAEGTTVRVPVVKNNGDYSTTVTYTVSGSAVNPADHNAADGSIVLAWSETQNYITFNTIADGLSEGDETIIFTLQTLSPTGQGILGNKIIHTVTITESNLQPVINLAAMQSGQQTHLVVAGNGKVTLTASVTDPNPGDSHSYDWSLSNNNLVDDNLDGDPATFVFDPSGLMPGFYKARVTVTDNGSPVLAVANELLFEVVTTAPVFVGFFTDTDGDFIRDSLESYDDSDNDGIPDYLDPNYILSQPDRNLPLNALQQVPAHFRSYVMRTDPGLALRLGDIAFAAGSDAAQVSVADIANFGDGEGGVGTATAQDIIPNIGGYFDFEITSLPVAGTSANVVIPQFEALPSGARYRKYHPINGWNDFVEDANNVLASAPGIPGICPLPGDAAYIPGLTPGHLCVQLTIEDGGPNDTDGIANHVIEDPGQIGTIESERITIQAGVNDNEPPAANNLEGNAGEPAQINDDTPSGFNESQGGGVVNLTVILCLFFLTLINLWRRRYDKV